MRIYITVTAILGWFALLLQFPLTLATSRANGMTIAGAVITYFSFFTILTNFGVVLGLTVSLGAPNSNLGRFCSRPAVTAGTAVSIAMVGAGYSLLLRHLWDPEGLQKIADVVLHDLVPVLYVAYWLIFAPKNVLRWKSLLAWLIYPLGYFFLVLVRGALSGRYPYPFLDATALGYPRVLFNAVLLLCAFFAISVVIVAISRRMGRASTAHA